MLASATVAAGALILVAGLAAAYWTAESVPGGHGASAVAAVNQGSTPTAGATVHSVTVNWAVTTLTTGQAVSGYIVKRYSGADLQTILPACTGRIAVTSCVESNVPTGTWTYSVTPVFATNWMGVESARSTTVTVWDQAPTAVANSYSVNEDATLNVAAPGVLANDTDPEGDTLFAVLVSGTPGLTLGSDGSVAYTPPADFNGPATFTYKANDGVLDSNTVTVTLTVNALNDAPVVTTTASSLAYTENGTLAVDSGATVTDVDSANLASATVRMTTGYVNGQDTLAFTNQNGITGVWTAATGTMALSGTATAANYQTALRSITYNDNSDTPNTSNRAVTFAAGDGSATSATATRTIVFTAVNDAPVVTATVATLAFTENSTPLLDSGLTITDADSANLTSATVTMTTNHVVAEDTLTFVNQNGITGSWNPGSGVLSLAGSATVANYQVALRSITYSNDDNPTTTTRTVTFLVNDGNLDSNVASRTITLTAVNDAPLNSVPGAQTINMNSARVFSVGNGNLISISDLDADTSIVQFQLVSTNGTATLSGTTGLALQAGANGSATMTYRGTITAINTALAGVTFNPTTNFTGAAGLQLVTSDRGFTGTGGTLTDTDAITITVARAPVLTTTATNLAYTEGGTLAVDTGLLLTDADSANLVSATVSISTGYVNGQDTLAFTNQNGITGVWTAATGTLAVSGSTTVGNYRTALRSITYNDNSDIPNTANRVVSFVVSDGALTSNTATRTITIAALNDAPVVTTTVATLAYTENASPLLDSAITVVDSDSATLTSATVTMTTNHVVAEDTLTFVNQNGITGTWTPATGILALSGAATVANYQTALGSISYSDSSNNPTTTTRTVTFVVNDGTTSSATASRTITLTAINDAPVDSVPGNQLAKMNTAKVFSSGNGNLISISDLDAGINTIDVQLVTTNGTTTLSGTTGLTLQGGANGSANMTYRGTVANLDTALAGLSFNPTTSYFGAASLQIVTSDRGFTGTGGTLTDTDTVSITVDSPPLVTATASSLSYTENGTTPVDTGLTVNDADDATLTTATVTMTTGYLNGQDTLTFTNQNGISGVWTAASGRMVLSGSATVSDYQIALRSITYTNGSENPNTTTRTVTLSASDGDFVGNTASRTITIIAVNDAPTATATVSSMAYTENGTTAVDPGMTVTDLDSTNLVSATARITTGYVNGQDALVFTTQNGITGVWTAATGTMALSGSTTVANYQTALRSITYTNNSNNPDVTTRTVTFVANDATLPSNTVSRTITITAVNDAPVVTATVATLAYTENASPLLDSAITVTDSDNANLASVTMTMTTNHVVAEDTLDFDDQNGITGTWNPSTGVLALSGTASVATYQTALRSITYTDSSDSPTTTVRTVTFVANDGAVNSNTATRTITLTAVNDAPVNSVPGGQTINRNTARVFSSANGNLISISDLDAAANAIDVQLVSTNGTATLSGTAGLTLRAGANGSATMTYRGTITNLNTALAGVSFNPTTNFTGAASLRIVTSDLGFTGSGGTLTDTDTITVTVVRAPVVTATVANLVYTENGTTAVDGGLTVTDADSANLVSATVALTTGYVNGQDVLAFTNQNGITGVWSAVSGAMVLSGSATVANYQVALRSVTYNDNSNNPSTVNRTVTFVANDGSINSNTATRAITVTAINDAPVVTPAGSTLAYTENGTPLLDPAITVTDADNANLASATVTMTTNHVVAEDTLTFVNQNGITGTWTPATGILALAGSATVANYQTALASITYTDSSNNPTTATRTVTFVANDGATSSTTATRTITITSVNDAPVNSVPGGQITKTNTSRVFSSGNGNLISISDVDAGASSVQVQLISTNGTAALSGTTGLSFTSGSNGTADMTFTGTTTNVNTALAGLSFNPTTDYFGAASLQIITSDQGSTGSGGPLMDNETIAITVDSAPVVTATVAGMAYTENGTTPVDPGLTVTDADDLSLTSATMTVTTGYVNGQDTLAFTNQNGITGVWTAASGTMALSGSATVANYQLALRSITYTNSSDNPSTANRTVTFVATDGDYASNVASRTVAVTAVNDASVVTATVANLVYAENGTSAVDGGLTVTDADSANLVSATVTLTTGYVNGQDVLAFTNQNGISGVWSAASGAMVLSGSATVANYQLALRSVTFNDNSNNPSTANRAVTFVANDGSITSNTATRTITVTAINDAPVNTVPGGQTIFENTPRVFSSGNGDLISIDDIDAGTNTVQVQLVSTNGSTTLSGTAGLTFTGGANGTANMTFTGSMATINAALAGLGFNPTTNYTGAAASLQLVTSDLGNVGTGGTLTDTDTIAITVNYGIFTNIANVGAGAAAPTSSTYAASTYTEVGNGTDIYATTDQFHFLYRSWTGDGTITARVTSLGGTSSASAKAGVMFRETTNADSRHVMMDVQPATGAGAEFAFRNTTTGNTTYASTAGIAPTYWVRLVRVGSTFTGYTAPDVAGSPGTWTLRGTQTFSVAMPATIYVGLATLSHSATVTTAATYDNVSVG